MDNSLFSVPVPNRNNTALCFLSKHPTEICTAHCFLSKLPIEICTVPCFLYISTQQKYLAHFFQNLKHARRTLHLQVAVTPKQVQIQKRPPNGHYYPIGWVTFSSKNISRHDFKGGENLWGCKLPYFFINKNGFNVFLCTSFLKIKLNFSKTQGICTVH